MEIDPTDARRHEEMEAHYAELGRMRDPEGVKPGGPEVKLCCPNCGNTKGFTAVGHAVYTAHLDGRGDHVRSTDYEENDGELYLDVRCGVCEAGVEASFDPDGEAAPRDADAKIHGALTRYVEAAREKDLQKYLLEHAENLPEPPVPNSVCSMDEWSAYDRQRREHAEHVGCHRQNVLMAGQLLKEISVELGELLPPVWYVAPGLGVKARLREADHPDHGIQVARFEGEAS